MEKTFFFRTGELVWEEIIDLTFFFFFFVIIFTLFSVSPFLKFGVPKCREFYVDFKKEYPYIVFRGDVHLFSLIYTQVSKLRTCVT